MNSLTKRILTGSIGALILLIGISWNIYSFSFLMFLTVFLGLDEFYKFSEKAGAEPQKILGLILSCASGFFLIVINKNLYNYAAYLGVQSLVIILLFISISILTIELFRKKENPMANIAFTFFGALYLAIPCALAIVLGDKEVYSAFPILGYFLLIWANDTGAYFAGKNLGKTKLFERISPNKTWEGTIGGALLSLIIALILAYFIDSHSLKEWLIISILVTVAGNYGDLLESLFKRSLGIKDSGTILPGHGGVLDRFDSFFFVIPTIYIYLKIAELF